MANVRRRMGRARRRPPRSTAPRSPQGPAAVARVHGGQRSGVQRGADVERRASTPQSSADSRRGTPGGSPDRGLEPRDQVLIDRLEVRIVVVRHVQQAAVQLRDRRVRFVREQVGHPAIDVRGRARADPAHGQVRIRSAPLTAASQVSVGPGRTAGTEELASTRGCPPRRGSSRVQRRVSDDQEVRRAGGA